MYSTLLNENRVGEYRALERGGEEGEGEGDNVALVSRTSSSPPLRPRVPDPEWMRVRVSVEGV